VTYNFVTQQNPHINGMGASGVPQLVGQDSSRRIDPNAPPTNNRPEMPANHASGNAPAGGSFQPNNADHRPQTNEFVSAPRNGATNFNAGFSPGQGAPTNQAGPNGSGAPAGQGAPAGAAPSSPENPGIALDGYCSVTLTEQRKWKKGDAAFGAIHRNRTYIFTGPEEQQKFLANPDKYSPMLSGYDPVRYAEQGQWVFGKRQHGLTFGDQMYLFSDEASLQQFWKQPQTYVRVAQEAMRSSVSPNVHR
jgi:YHS domain-containing protein